MKREVAPDEVIVPRIAVEAALRATMANGWGKTTKHLQDALDSTPPPPSPRVWEDCDEEPPGPEVQMVYDANGIVRQRFRFDQALWGHGLERWDTLPFPLTEIPMPDFMKVD